MHTLYRSRKEEIRIDILKEAVLHTAKKRESTEDMQDWKKIIQDIREESQMHLLWSNYVADNKYIGDLQFNEVLDTVNEIATLLNI